MDACAEYNRKVLLLDRPNPNGHYVDGPILDMKYKSGVGWLPIPIVHGMTLGELALMVNGERWLPASRVSRPYRHTLQELYAPDKIHITHSPLSQPAERPVDPSLPFTLFLRRDQYQCRSRDLLSIPDIGSTRCQIRRFHLYAHLLARFRHETVA